MLQFSSKNHNFQVEFTHGQDLVTLLYEYLYRGFTFV